MKLLIIFKEENTNQVFKYQKLIQVINNHKKINNFISKNELCHPKEIIKNKKLCQRK